MATGTRSVTSFNPRIGQTESKVLMPTFSGKHSEWENFKFRFSAYLAKTKLLQATREDFDANESLESTTKNNDLYYTLALCSEAPEFVTLIMDAPDGAGQYAWHNPYKYNSEYFD